MATVYVCAGQGSPSGPFAWIARIVSSESVSELAGDGKDHFSRLQIVAAIAAFEALPKDSTVHLICSDQYLVTHVMDRLDALVAGKVRKSGKKPIANTDLFPALLKARDRHAEVTQKVVPWDARDAEHDAAAEACRRIIDQLKEGEPIPSAKARPVALRSKKEMREASGLMVDHPAAQPQVIMQGVGLDVPW